jgi:hypothetical protein
MIPRDDLPFRPKVRWRFWIPILIVLAGAVAVYFAVEARRARVARRQLLVEHAMLTESIAPGYRATRARIEQLAFSAAGAWQGTFVAPGFTLQSLSGEPVLYGRIRVPEIHRIADVETSIRHRYPDQLASCLGIEIDLAHRFYSLGDFLMPAYVDGVHGENDAQRLQFLRQDLEYRLRRDTPERQRRAPPLLRTRGRRSRRLGERTDAFVSVGSAQWQPDVPRARDRRRDGDHSSTHRRNAWRRSRGSATQQPHDALPTRLRIGERSAIAAWRARPVAPQRAARDRRAS